MIKRAIMLGCVVTFIITMHSCVQRELIKNKRFAIQSFHDSLLLEVGVSDSNYGYFIIRNERQNDYLLIDTSYLRFDIVGETLIISEDEASFHKMIHPNPALIKCDSFFYFKEKLNKKVNQVSMRITITVLNGKHPYYNDSIDGITLNYKKRECLVLTQIIPSR
jgi:ribosomal protein L31